MCSIVAGGSNGYMVVVSFPETAIKYLSDLITLPSRTQCNEIPYVLLLRQIFEILSQIIQYFRNPSAILHNRL